MVRKLHKYISLSLLAVWLLQALTGVSNVFSRELDASLIEGRRASLNEELLLQRIDQLRQDRKPGRLSSVYASGGDPNQFDVFLHTPDDGLHVLRLDGEGNVLREQPWAIDFARSGFLLSMRLIHETLFLGDYAMLFIGFSGVFLFSNIVLGLVQAWPGKGQWRSALTVRAAIRSDLKLLAWHRAAGFWFAIPLLLVVASGVGVVWTETIESVIGEPVAMRASNSDAATYREEKQIKLQDALGAARELYPDARLSIISMPESGQPYFKIRLLQEHELRRVFGKTFVLVGAENGEVLANFDAATRPVRNRIVDAFYAVHTGEAAGLPGRILVLVGGTGLFALIGLGLSLWASRKRRGGRSKASP